MRRGRPARRARRLPAAGTTSDDATATVEWEHSDYPAPRMRRRRRHGGELCTGVTSEEATGTRCGGDERRGGHRDGGAEGGSGGGGVGGGAGSEAAAAEQREAALWKNAIE
nr:unnamed protein product [Digitaria exilis]